MWFILRKKRNKPLCVFMSYWYIHLYLFLSLCHQLHPCPDLKSLIRAREREKQPLSGRIWIESTGRAKVFLAPVGCTAAKEYTPDGNMRSPSFVSYCHCWKTKYLNQPTKSESIQHSRPWVESDSILSCTSILLSSFYEKICVCSIPHW